MPPELPHAGIGILGTGLVTAQTVPTDLMGPLGLTAFAITVVGVLARVAREYIDELKAQRDTWKERSLATDARLDRIVKAFEQATKQPAPE